MQMIRKIELENHTYEDLFFSEPVLRRIEGSDDHIAEINIYKEERAGRIKVKYTEGIDYTVYHANLPDQKIDHHDGMKWAK